MPRPLLAALTALCFACAVAAQGPPSLPEKSAHDGDVLSLSEHPLDCKAAAQARFAAAQAEPRELISAQLAAAKTSHEARFREFLAGRGTLELLLESFVQVTAAGLALSNDPGEQAAYHEAYWLLTFAAEDVNRARYEAKRIPLQAYAQSQAARFHAEGLLQRHWAQRQQKGFGACLLPEYFVDDAALPLQTLTVQEMAKAKLQATQTDEQDLQQSLLVALRVQADERFRNFLDGRGTFDFLLESMAEQAHAYLGAGTNSSERLAACEVLWLFARESERLNDSRYRAGRIPIQDYATSLQFRLDAELQLLEARAKHGKAVPDRLNRDPDLRWLFHRIESDYWKLVARDKYRTLQANALELQQARLAATVEECHSRGKEFLAGRGTLSFLRDAMGRLLTAELAVAGNAEARSQALERHWHRTLQVERIDGFRYEHGRVPITEYLDSLYQRLDAELWLKQFQTNQQLPTIPFRSQRTSALTPTEATANFNLSNP